MNTVEQVKASINGLSISDQSDVLLHMLRLKYQTTLGQIRKLSPSNGDAGDSIEHLSYDALLERLHLLEGVLEGLQDSEQGKVISHDAIKRQFELWRKQ